MVRIQLAIVSSILTFMLPRGALAQSVNLSLNLQYTNPADPALGGAWTLVAKTDSAHGIASIHAILSNINPTGITAQSGIGAVLNSGGPFINTSGSLVEALYFQDLSSPGSVVTNVGRGAGTPGNLALDPLNDPQWNNSARVFSGTFGALTPVFTTNSDAPPNATEANVLSTAVPPYTFALPASVTTIVRSNLNVSGDDTWDNSSGNALWSDAVNWADNTEPGAAQTAIFPAGFPNSDAAITLAAGETVRQLTFHDSYVLAGGTLTLSGPDSVLHVAAGKTATISSALTASGNVQLSGGGDAVVSHARAAGGLSLLSGSLKVAPNGGNAGTSRVASLQINAGSQLDLTNNDLIITNTVATTVRDLIKAERLMTTTAAPSAGKSAGLGWAQGNDPAIAGLGGSLSGQSFTAADTLVKYTYFGDGDLDGDVDGNDVARWGLNFTGDLAAGTGTKTWTQGDWDYDGDVDGNDAARWGLNFTGDLGGNGLSVDVPVVIGSDAVAALASLGISVNVVPEPAGLSALAAAAYLLARRARRGAHGGASPWRICRRAESAFLAFPYAAGRRELGA